MELRAERLFSAHWTTDIDQEYLRNMQGAFGLSEATARRRLSAMKKWCPEWQVAPSAAALARVPGKVDPKDRHVAATALTLRQYADEDNEDGTPYDVYLVTDNTRHFATRDMAALGVTVLKAGAFLDVVYNANPAEAARAVLKAVDDLTNPPYTPAELLGALQAHGAKQLVSALTQHWGVNPQKRAANRR